MTSLSSSHPTKNNKRNKKNTNINTSNNTNNMNDTDVPKTQKKAFLELKPSSTKESMPDFDALNML